MWRPVILISSQTNSCHASNDVNFGPHWDDCTRHKHITSVQPSTGAPIKCRFRSEHTVGPQWNPCYFTESPAQHISRDSTICIRLIISAIRHRLKAVLFAWHMPLKSVIRNDIMESTLIQCLNYIWTVEQRRSVLCPVRSSQYVIISNYVYTKYSPGVVQLLLSIILCRNYILILTFNSCAQPLRDVVTK